MEQTTRPPGPRMNDGGPTAPGPRPNSGMTQQTPVVNTGRQNAPLMPAQASELTRLLGALQNYILNEESLVLVEFLIVALIGLIVFVSVYHPLDTFINGIGTSLSKGTWFRTQ